MKNDNRQSTGDSITSAKSAKRILVLAILLLNMGGLSALAQFSSGIEGTARDQSGAVISGATVTVTDTRLGVTKATKTSEAGYFRIDSIAATSYTVAIQAGSSTSWVQYGIT